MIARLPPLLIWFIAALGAASVGLAAMPVVLRLTGDPAILPADPVPASDPAPRPDLTAILDFAPFGRVAAPVDQTATETALGLTLHGVTLTKTASGSQAIIAGGDLAVGSYRIGAAITAGAELVEVYPDHVVLRVDGRLQTLSFPTAAWQIPAPEPLPGVDTHLRNLIPTPQEAGPGAPARDLSDQLAQVRADLQRNPGAVLTKYGLEPAGEGYRVTDATPGVLRDLGLLPGDLVVTLNGQPLGDITADRSLFDAVAASGQARLAVVRDKGTFNLSIPLQ